ncbi:uncharacterized protein ARMOST_11467 [Armillaria ostoyae]|uniref:Uncharacterized protein n=1 Tax=Armillaria ostoyae TaxID=47428 RepID=A0A284RH74_ARMOS|nr:uncharacterized protein ARMOST_11467 [Armillaria ostoyae]
MYHDNAIERRDSGGFFCVVYGKVIERTIDSTLSQGIRPDARFLALGFVSLAHGQGKCCTSSEQTLAPSAPTLLLTMGLAARQLWNTVLALNLRRATDQLEVSIASSPKSGQLEAFA